MGVVVGVPARAVGIVGAVPAQEAHIIHQRVAAGLPKRRHRARIDAAGEKPDARHDIVAAPGRFQQRPGRTDAGKAGRIVRQVNLGDGGVQPDQHRVGFQPDGVTHDVAATGQVQHLVRVDRLLQGRGVVGLVVAHHPQSVDIDPFAGRGQCPDGGAEGGGKEIQLVAVPARADLAHRTGRGQNQAMLECAHGIGTGAIERCQRSAAFPEAREYRCVGGDRRLKTDLGIDVFLVGNDHRRL